MAARGLKPRQHNISKNFQTQVIVKQAPWLQVDPSRTPAAQSAAAALGAQRSQDQAHQGSADMASSDSTGLSPAYTPALAAAGADAAMDLTDAVEVSEHGQESAERYPHEAQALPNQHEPTPASTGAAASAAAYTQLLGQHNGTATGASTSRGSHADCVTGSAAISQPQSEAAAAYVHLLRTSKNPQQPSTHASTPSSAGTGSYCLEPLPSSETGCNGQAGPREAGVFMRQPSNDNVDATPEDETGCQGPSKRQRLLGPGLDQHSMAISHRHGHIAVADATGRSTTAVAGHRHQLPGSSPISSPGTAGHICHSVSLEHAADEEPACCDNSLSTASRSAQDDVLPYMRHRACSEPDERSDPFHSRPDQTQGHSRPQGGSIVGPSRPAASPNDSARPDDSSHLEHSHAADHSLPSPVMGHPAADFGREGTCYDQASWQGTAGYLPAASKQADQGSAGAATQLGAELQRSSEPVSWDKRASLQADGVGNTCGQQQERGPQGSREEPDAHDVTLASRAELGPEACAHDTEASRGPGDRAAGHQYLHMQQPGAAGMPSASVPSHRKVPKRYVTKIVSCHEFMVNQ